MPLALLLYVALVALGLTLQALTFIWNLWYWKARELVVPSPGVSVSVLIPARNELHNLPRLLAALRGQDYSPQEIIVCDDHSDDGLTDWLAAHAAEFGAEWFTGEAKPAGWVGKPWVCHQLAQRARGDWLLFLDADIIPNPGFLRHLAGLMTDTPAQMVTAFPRLEPSGLVDGLLECLVGFVVFALLPLQWSERPGRPYTAFANGQVIGFRRRDYQRLRPHEQVRGTIVDDVALARETKRRGQPVLLVDGVNLFAVRMYRSGWEAVDGFSKNAVSACGGVGPALLWWLAYPLWWLAPLVFAGLGQPWAWAVCGLTALLYGLCAVLGRLPWWYGLLYPLAMLLGWYVLGRSVIWHLRGDVKWKGRSYRLGGKGKDEC